MNQSKKGFKDNIEKETLENTDYRRVLFTGHLQLVLMSLKPREEIGYEKHEGHNQFFRFEAGQGTVIIDDEEFEVSDGDSVIIPDGAGHNVINVSETEDLKLYTIYAPAEHPEGTIYHTKKESEE